MATSRREPLSFNTSTYDSGGGQDYTDLAVWEAATDIDLVTATSGEVLNCFAGDHDDLVNLNTTAGFNNSSYFRVIRPASGEGHSGIPLYDGTVVSFSTSGGFGQSSIFTDDDYSQIQDICFRVDTDSDGFNYQVRACDGAAFVGCLAINGGGSGQHRHFNGRAGVGNTAFFVNCMGVDGDDNFRGVDGTVYFLNCTSIDATDDGVAEQGGDAIAKNCISVGSTGDDYQAGVTTTTCLDEDGSGDITGSPSFVNTVIDDYHLNLGSAGINVGTDLSADTYAFDDDINDGVMGASKAGETRSGTWDVGFDEFVGAPPGILLRNLTLMGAGR